MEPVRTLPERACKVLTFDEEVRTDYRLLEVDESVLNEIVQHGVVIKGAADAEAVLVTRSKTYAVKYVETTNLQLLVAPRQADDEPEGSGSPMACDEPEESATQALRSPAGLQTQVHKMHELRHQTPLLVSATAKAHLELSEVRPQLQRLHSLLSQRLYSGPEDEPADIEEQPHAAGDDDIEGDASGQGQGHGAAGADQAMQGMEEQQGWCGAQAGDHMDVDQAGSGAAAGAACKHGARQMRRRRQPAGLYTFQQLLARVQASEAQVQAELEALHAVQLDGRWRLVEPAYLGHLLELIILSAQAEGWSLAAIPVDPLCQLLAAEGYRPEVVAHCLRMHSTATSGSPAGAEPDSQAAICKGGAGKQQRVGSREEAGVQDTGRPARDQGRPAGPEEQGTYALDEVLVCKYFARKLLQEHAGEGSGADPAGLAATPLPSRPMTCRQLMAGWQDAVPAGMQPDLNMLRGEVLITGKGPEAQVRLFPVSSLPSEPRERFAALFSVRPQWEAADLEPYLAGLQAPGQTGGALLLKYARASQPSPAGPTFYTAR